MGTRRGRGGCGGTRALSLRRVGWPVLAELQSPAAFEAASELVTENHMRNRFGCGPDVGAHLPVIQRFVDAGFDRLALLDAGPDPDGFRDFFATELSSPARSLTPARRSRLRGSAAGVDSRN